jgi:ribokinase
MQGDSVLFFGDINVDNIFTLPEIPEPGRDGYASHTKMSLGGAVCNSAVVMQRLGQPSALLGVVGEDLWADFVFSELKRAQINADTVFVKPGEKTGLIFIVVTPNGERTMFSYRGVNTHIQPEDLPEKLLDNVSLIQLSGYAFMESPQQETAWCLLEMASSHGIPICMDTGLDPVIHRAETLRDVLPYLTVLITGQQEAFLLTQLYDPQDQIDALLSAGLNQVGIKLGAEGAILGWQDGMLQQSAFQVQVRDTTSAGDAFSAGLIYAYLHDFSPRASLTLANALGGLATTVYGAAWIGREEVSSFLLRQQNAGLDLPDLPAIQEINQHFRSIERH